jgi:NAD(P)-dependent dehydrogenase (short-subunit alcohol dehydrogenase family)
MSDNNKKNVLVMGASKAGNMGQVIANAFLKQGDNVVVSGRNKEGLDSFCEDNKAISIPCDISSEIDIKKLAKTIDEKLGHIDVIIQASGYGISVPFLDMKDSDLTDIVNIQFKGPFQLFQACIPLMKNGGAIIQISSATASIMLENYAAYMGTKAGIDHVVRCIANEFGHQNIRANSISPGLTDTPMTADSVNLPGLESAFVKEYPLGRIGTSEDVARTALFLADKNCFISGQNIQVSGGLTLRRNPSMSEIMSSIEKHSE